MTLPLDIHTIAIHLPQCLINGFWITVALFAFDRVIGGRRDDSPALRQRHRWPTSHAPRGGLEKAEDGMGDMHA